MIIQSTLSDSPGLRPGSKGAFTLIEVLIAVLVSAIVFAAIYSGISNCYGLLQTSRGNLRATQIMISELEGIRLCSWGDGTNLPTQLFNTNIVPTTFTNYFYPLGLGVGTNGLDDGTNLGTPYYGTVTVMQLTNPAEQSTVFNGSMPGYATNMALVTVTLHWTDGLRGKQVTHTRHMSTLVAQYGIQNYVIQN